MNGRFTRDMLGSMTRVEPLTPELLSKMSCEDLTYEELEASMSRMGLDIHKILCDPTKRYRQAFYVDFDRGYYFEILFQKSCLNDLLRIAAASLEGEKKNRYLEAGKWTSYYSCDVPVPMKIYDFQRRYKQIPEDEVFEVWRIIHTRIDYANAMWDPEVLAYVFDRAPDPELPELDEDGLITVYRGMGELSQPPEKALSWTTNPINALWFANRGGRGTKVLVARIRPEQVVAYFPTFRDENEVIVRPGSDIQYQQEDFVPSTLDYVPDLLEPAMGELVFYARVARSLGYPTETPFQYHGLKHILRVLLLSLIYFYNSGDDLSEEDKQILIYFSLLHDYGREDEYVDDDHGAKSLEKIERTNTRLRSIRLSRKGYRIASMLIKHHCHDDEVGLTAIQTEIASPGLIKPGLLSYSGLRKIWMDSIGYDSMDWTTVCSGRRSPGGFRWWRVVCWRKTESQSFVHGILAGRRKAMTKKNLLIKCPFVKTLEQMDTVDGRSVFSHKVGHMRADYANGRWYNTVWPCHEELCTPEIAKEIDCVYEQLISNQCFPDLMALKQFCYSHPEAAVGEQDQDEYNFYLVGQHCDFWLRLITRNNDYNLYLSAFVKAPDNQCKGASL